ncbi:MAG: NAD(P)/FAD-dependent oxidoreductase [Vulcanimicrobiota bacterium]
MQKYDAVVIGGGHNGLVNAAYLGKAGLKVALLERRPVVGGATITEEIYPGFKYLTGSYLISLLRPQVIRELELPKHGLEILPLESTVAPLLDGDYFADWPDHDMTRQEIERFSRKDAESYDEFNATMRRIVFGVKPILDMIPPDPTSLEPHDLAQMARVRGTLDRMERRDFHTLCRLMTMSAADFLDEWFETAPLKAIKSTSGIIGTFLGVRSAGTGYVLLHHYLGELNGVPRAWGFAKGGTGGLSQSIARSARAHGVEIFEDTPVERILVENGRAVGVATAKGDEFRADRVISGAHAHPTFLKMMDPGDLPEEYLADINRWRTRGPSCKVNLALDGLPDFPAIPKNKRALLRGSIEIAPSVDYLEKAYDDAKYGGWSRRPFMDALMPSLLDPGMAPPGKHIMSLFVQYADADLKGGWTEQKKAEFLEVVVDTLSEHSPDLKDKILHKHIMTPDDLERVFGLTGGHIFHGELTLPQLFFMRPSPQWANYRTPIKNLWMCGSSCHPGGCITGAPGRNAALEILSEVKEQVPV